MTTMPTTNEAPERAPPRSPREGEIRSLFRARARELAALFPQDGMEKVTRAVAMACRVSQRIDAEAMRRDKADNVTAASIAEAALSCLYLDLDVDEHAYVYPFAQEAKLVIGPRGLLALAYRSGFIKDAYAGTVFWADVDDGLFDYDIPSKMIRHKKALRRGEAVRRPWSGDTRVPERELLAYAYCVIDTTTQGRVLEVLTQEDVEWFRHFSTAPSGASPWSGNYAAMARKTAIKRALENVPRSPLLSAALRETSEGSFQIPADTKFAELIDKAIRARNEGKPMPPPAPAAEPEYEPTGTVTYTTPQGQTVTAAAGTR
jgi:phage RecT family recombinase